MKRIPIILFLAFFLCVESATASYQILCVQKKDGDAPFPLGARAPLPWDMIGGYWAHYGDGQFKYRIEVTEVLQDQSRSVQISVMDETMTNVVGHGVGFIRGNSWDLWARVKGQDLDLKIRIQAFFPKDSTDLTQRVLLASVKDMRVDAPKCTIRHALRKVDVLEAEKSTPTQLSE